MTPSVPTSPGCESLPTSTNASVQLVPSVQKNVAWTWTGLAPEVPVSPSVPNIVENQKLTANLWNLSPEALGSTTMALNSRGQVETNINFASAPPKSSAKDSFVRGYPNIEYGMNPPHPEYSAPASAQVPLPEPVSSTAGLTSTIAYTLNAQSDAAYDFAYDIWLTPTASRYRAGEPELELMVWTDYSAQPHTLPPGYVETTTVPIRVNGKEVCETWKVYFEANPENHRVTVWYLPATPRASGAVTTNLNAFLARMGRLTEARASSSLAGVPFASFYLDEIDVGSEFGPAPTVEAVNGSGPAHISWLVENFSVSQG